LKLNNEGNYLFIEPLFGEFGGASCARRRHRIDPALNGPRSGAHDPKHSDPEGPVTRFVQTLQPARNTLDPTGCGTHTSRGGHGNPASRTHLARIQSRLQIRLLIGKKGQLSVQNAKATKGLLARGSRGVQDSFGCSNQIRP